MDAAIWPSGEIAAGDDSDSMTAVADAFADRLQLDKGVAAFGLVQGLLRENQRVEIQDVAAISSQVDRYGVLRNLPVIPYPGNLRKNIEL